MFANVRAVTRNGDLHVTRRSDAGPLLRAWLVPKVRPVDLARAAGCSHQYVSAVLAGRKPPSEKLLEAARELGIPVEVILKDRGE